MQYFSPKSDFVFKQIFGDPNNTDILADFLKAILDIPADDYEKIDLVDTHLNKKYFADKIGILDLKITTKSGHIIDVEIQKSNLADIDKRIAFYLSRLIVDQIGDSDPYTKIKRSIVIFIADYELIKNSHEYHKVWRLRDENGRDFSNVMELNTIELPKLPEKNDHNDLWAWLKFLNSKSQEDFKSVSNENEKIAKAVNTLRNISMSDEARTAYRAEQKSKMDSMAREKYMLEEGMKKGIKKGKKEGIKEGIIKGKEEGMKEGIKEGMVKGKEEGLKEGEIKKAIEDVINLISATKMSIEEAMKILKVDFCFKEQIENELEKRGIKYDE